MHARASENITEKGTYSLLMSIFEMCFGALRAQESLETELTQGGGQRIVRRRRWWWRLRLAEKHEKNKNYASFQIAISKNGPKQKFFHRHGFKY